MTASAIGPTETKRERSPAMGKKLGVGKRMEELLREGKSTAEVLVAIHTEFPLSRATGADVGIIRRKCMIPLKLLEKPAS